MGDPWGWAGESLILRSLAPAVRSDLERAATEVSLKRGDSVFDGKQPIRFVLLPTSGMISLVTTMRDGSRIETHTVGREGIVGAPFIRQRRALLPNLEAVCQMPGDGLNIPVETFAALMERHAELSDLVDRFVHCVIGQMGQSAACNRLHPLEERLAKWLLHAHDRSGTGELPLTHEFLADMLGVRRETVTIAVARLEEEGLVGHRRGHLSVDNRAGLEGASCECYAIVRAEIDSVVPTTD
jgi:CRP-like cAMP-binding protein